MATSARFSLQRLHTLMLTRSLINLMKRVNDNCAPNFNSPIRPVTFRYKCTAWGKGPWPSHNTMYAKTERALWRMARPCSVVAKPADTKGCPDSNQSNSKRSSWQWTTILDRHSKFLYMDKWEKFTSCRANGLVLSNPIVLNISIITMQLLLRGYRRTDSHL